MRTRKRYAEGESNDFNLSISDLMSALCGIFALIMITVVVQLNTTKAEYVAKNQKAEEYYSMQTELYDDLIEEFEADLQKWNAEITKDLTIRFKNDDILFEPFKKELKPKFKLILIGGKIEGEKPIKPEEAFFPRLIKVISKTAYRDKIEEIRIEGHTSREQNKEFDIDYIEGMELSQGRTREVMLCCLNSKGINNKDKEWAQKNIAAIGYSLSRPVKYENGKDNWEASRRVEFKIKTKAEKVIEELADKEFKVTHE